MRPGGSVGLCAELSSDQGESVDVFARVATIRRERNELFAISLAHPLIGRFSFARSLYH